MAENEIPQSLSDTVSRLMESPEVAGILSALKGGEEHTESSATAPPAVSIPPDIMAKLPSMISALSGMGIGAPTEMQKSKNEETPKKAGDKQRKALLTSLRPYLSPHRQSIIDNMLKIEGLTGILSTVSIPTSGNTTGEGR